ncbi:exonuclease [Arthrobacter phage Auxilium]|uniref:Exonuclease n=1 Tax=Arthrobacter phage Auxilium TaxID=2419948 RepID=A0A3G2KA53_9CAUD|nr:exonuclease [Arthrobacter phage Auxilium]AYN55840.1 exonuclease [Arthrobacter phage Auxilium]
MSLHIYEELDQGTPEWLAARAGIVTASVVGNLISKGAPDALTVDCPKCLALPAESCISTARKVPTPIKTPHDERVAKASHLPPVYGVASTDTARAIISTLVAERITGFVEQIYPSRDMERGTLSEPYARDIYAENYAPESVSQVGFMVREFDGYRIGYSPDGLVGDDGLIEIKSPRQKKHLATILAGEVPAEHMAQCQTGLLVSGRKWIDFISYNGGMPLWHKRVAPDEEWFTAIKQVAAAYEETAATMIANYKTATSGLPETERIDFFPEMEITF